MIQKNLDPPKVHKLVAVGHMTQLGRNMVDAQNVETHFVVSCIRGR